MSKPVSPIPSGFNTITAHLNVKGAEAYVDFLKQAFNAVEVNRSPGPGGKLMHVLMRIGDSMIMFDIRFSSRPCLVFPDPALECSHSAEVVVPRPKLRRLYIAAVAAARLIGPTAVTLRGTVYRAL